MHVAPVPAEGVDGETFLPAEQSHSDDHRKLAPYDLCDACPAVDRADTFGKGPRDEASAAQRPGSAFQLLPHFLIALSGPDPRVGVLGRLVIGAGDVERHA